MDTDERRNNLLLTASLVRAVAQVASALDDPEICDSRLLLEFLALADRADYALSALSRQPPN